MRVENRQCRLLDLHLGRLKTSAQANLPLPDDCETRIRQYIAKLPDGLFRLKAELVSDDLILSHAATTELPAPQRIIPARHPPRCDYLRRFKTTRRALYDQAWQTAADTRRVRQPVFQFRRPPARRRQKQRVRQIPRAMAHPVSGFGHPQRRHAPSRVATAANLLGRGRSHRNAHHPRHAGTRRRNPPLNALRGVFEADLVYGNN